MLTAEFVKAFAEASDGFNIRVASRSRKEYWLHIDQLPAIISGGMVHAVPARPHPRAKNNVFWLKPENLRLAAE